MQFGRMLPRLPAYRCRAWMQSFGLTDRVSHDRHETLISRDELIFVLSVSPTRLKSRAPFCDST